MKIGASTACLYPMETEKAFLTIAEQGIKNTEVFFNAASELSGDVLVEIERISAEYQMKIISVHPFQSAFEPLCLFTGYKRREQELFDEYERYFDVMNRLGASIFVFHGALKNYGITHDFYMEQFLKLQSLGKKHGITVAQENIAYCVSSEIELIKRMRDELGAQFVLDVKQAVRAGQSPFEIAQIYGKSLVHCHISDHNAQSSCLPVGEGEFDVPSFFSLLNKNEYNGAVILELYRQNFGEPEELKKSVDLMKSLF